MPTLEAGCVSDASQPTALAGLIYAAECPLGRGVFAGKPIAPGEAILEFSGPIITLAQTIEMGEQEANPLQITPNEYLDLQPPGVFLNHACTPNAGIRENRRLVALTEIQQGIEIRYDYSTTMDENRWTMICRCDAPHCRGIVRDFRLLPPVLQQHYLLSGVVQPFIAAQYKPNRATPAYP